MAGSQISTSVTIIDSLHGYQALSLTEYNTSAACSIAAGSVVEIAGAFFTFLADETIEASTWTSIVTATTAYITLTASGTAGSQIVSARYTPTAPEWRDDFQGWYASVGSNIRVVGSVYKAEAANYGPKYLLNSMQDQKQRSISVLNASVASSLSVNGINAVPYRITTETYIKTSYSTGGFTALTSITVYGALNGYCIPSSVSPRTAGSTSLVSANTIYASSTYELSAVVTNLTFVVSYMY